MRSKQQVAEELRLTARSDLDGGSLLKTLKRITGGTSWREVLLKLAELLEG